MQNGLILGRDADGMEYVASKGDVLRGQGDAWRFYCTEAAWPLGKKVIAGFIPQPERAAVV